MYMALNRYGSGTHHGGKHPGALLFENLGGDRWEKGERTSRAPGNLGKELSVQEDTGQQPKLVNLNDTNVHLEEPWQDLRGLAVYDSNDDQIGSVEDVYVDRERREARLLDVSAGGMLGIGKKRFLVPVEEVKRDVNEERITVEHPKEKVMESPEFDPDNGLKMDLQRAIYAYYGHSVGA